MLYHLTLLQSVHWSHEKLGISIKRHPAVYHHTLSIPTDSQFAFKIPYLFSLLFLSSDFSFSLGPLSMDHSPFHQSDILGHWSLNAET